MTVRDFLTRKKRKVSIIAFASWLILAIAGILSSRYKTFIFIVPAFIVFMASVIYLIFGIRCPRCKGMMGHVSSYSSGPFSISRKINYCPFCGLDINTEIGHEMAGRKE